MLIYDDFFFMSVSVIVTCLRVRDPARGMARDARPRPRTHTRPARPRSPPPPRLFIWLCTYKTIYNTLDAQTHKKSTRFYSRRQHHMR